MKKYLFVIVMGLYVLYYIKVKKTSMYIKFSKTYIFFFGFELGDLDYFTKP